MHFRRFWLAAPLCGLALSVPTATHASCGLAGPPPTLTAELAATQAAFVGSVLYTTDNNRSARVKVESIWKGPRLPAYVDVHGEAPGSGPFSGSEGDHQYQARQRYLFLPLNDRPPFQDYGDCNSSTVLYTAELAANAPPDAKLADSPTLVDGFANVIGQYSTAASTGAVAVVVIGIWLVLRRHRART